MQTCSKTDKKLSSLYNNVITQHGEKNRRVLYPTFETNNNCYDRPIYIWEPQLSDVATGRNFNIHLQLQLSNLADLLSFENEKISVQVEHDTLNGFNAKIKTAVFNSYSQISQTKSYNKIVLNISPTRRNQVALTQSIAPAIYCNVTDDQLQLDGSDLPRLKEIVSTQDAKVSLSYTDVEGFFNKSVSGKWPYAQFTSSDLIKNGAWSRPITEIDVSKGSKVKYKLQIENSRYYTGSVEEVITCF